MPKRAVLVFPQAVDDALAEPYAEWIADELSVRNAVVWWRWSDDLPDWIDVATADQVAAHKRDLGPTAVYMVVEVDEFTPD